MELHHCVKFRETAAGAVVNLAHPTKPGGEVWLVGGDEVWLVWGWFGLMKLMCFYVPLKLSFRMKMNGPSVGSLFM